MLHAPRWEGRCGVDVNKGPIYWKAHVPRLLFRNPEIRRLSLLLSKANVVIMSADELVSQRLEAGEEERSGGGKMRDGQGQMRDGHIGRLVGRSRVKSAGERSTLKTLDLNVITKIKGSQRICAEERRKKETLYLQAGNEYIR